MMKDDVSIHQNPVSSAESPPFRTWLMRHRFKQEVSTGASDETDE